VSNTRTPSGPPPRERPSIENKRWTGPAHSAEERRALIQSRREPDAITGLCGRRSAGTSSRTGEPPPHSARAGLVFFHRDPTRARAAAGHVLSAADMLLARRCSWKHASAVDATEPAAVRYGLPVHSVATARQRRAARRSHPVLEPAQLLRLSPARQLAERRIRPTCHPYLFVKEPPRATVWVALLRMWVAGLGAWLLARRLGVARSRLRSRA